MPLPNPFKLEKLKISAYGSRQRRLMDYIGSFEAMFNPESFAEKYEIVYSRYQRINSSGRALNYAHSKPSDLSLELILDGTGVDSMGIMKLFASQSVADRIKDFLDLAFRMNGSIHEPNFLLAQWGDLSFPCRLGSADIKYTRFDRDGTALRAVLALRLIADFSDSELAKRERKSSPDLTHTRIVKSGDTLPLLAKEIYGSSQYYLWVAQANGLDDIRELVPGQRLVFPPLTEPAP